MWNVFIPGELKHCLTAVVMKPATFSLLIKPTELRRATKSVLSYYISQFNPATVMCRWSHA